MPILRIDGHGTVEVAAGKRLVLAIEEAGVDILHRCGGHAKCTTCRVEFLSGQPEDMTKAERDKLLELGDFGEFRLACQCRVDADMHVKALMRLSTTKLGDAGPAPEANITPDPEWVEAPR